MRQTKTAIYVRANNEEDAILQTKALLTSTSGRGNTLDQNQIYTDTTKVKSPLNRPALSQLLKDARSKKYSKILVLSPDRIARDLDTFMQIEKSLDMFGAQLVFTGSVESKTA